MMNLKLNLKTEFFPPSERLFRDYVNADLQAINKAIDRFNCEKLFWNKDVVKQASLFKKIIPGIFHSHIAHKHVPFYKRNPLLTKGPHKAFDRKYLKDGRTKNFNKLLYTVICNEEGRIRSFKSKLLFALESFVFL